MTPADAGRLGRRLRRILVLLPYAIRHPGVSVDELSRKFGVKKQDLVADLNLVFLCGLPGYGPGDLIDVAVENDRVFVRMADYFSAPLKLTPAEAVALYAGGAAIADLPEMDEADALRRALAKLGRALGTGNGQEAAPIQVAGGPAGASEHLQTLRDALVDRKRVQLEYFSASRGELTERAVDPWGLFTALGRWYLIALDHSSDEERMFRVDRIRSARVLNDRAEVPDEFDADRYRGAFVRRETTGPQMELEVSPAVARWFEEYYPVTESKTLPDSWQSIRLAYSGERWAATLVLQLGADVRNVRPPAVLDAARGLARAIADRHGA
ncbi:MAG TPA: WYL domain-containing protein [Actinomycetota bacterium]